MRVAGLVLLMITMSLAMFVMVVATGGGVLQSAAIAMMMDPLRLAVAAALTIGFVGLMTWAIETDRKNHNH